MKTFKDESVDLIITDPPYGVDFDNDFYDDSGKYVFGVYKDWLSEMHRVLKDSSHIYIFVPTVGIEKWIKTFKDVGFEFKNLLISKCKSNNYSKNNYKHDTQFIIYGSKGKPKVFNEVDFQKTSDVWFKDKRNKKPKEYTYVYSSNFNRHSTELGNLVHPNQKSEDFIEILIKVSSNIKEVILDPFMGSGSTGLACKNTNRDFIGIELDYKYFNIAKERMK